MLLRASALAARARERIRAAREHDPYGWDERLDDRAPFSHEDVYRVEPVEPIDVVQIPDEPGDAAGSSSPPLGSPAPGAPDVDGAVGPGGISGAPQGGRSWTRWSASPTCAEGIWTCCARR